MDGYFKAVAAALITAVLCMVLAKQGKDTAVLLTILACVMILFAAFGYLYSLLDFFGTLEEMIALEGDHFQILFKVVGIGMVGETASLICTDAGNAALGKTLQILGTILILCLSLPLFQSLLELIGGILGGI